MDPIQDTFYYSTALARYVLSGSPLLFTDRCATITLNVIYAKGIIKIILQCLHFIVSEMTYNVSMGTLNPTILLLSS